MCTFTVRLVVVVVAIDVVVVVVAEDVVAVDVVAVNVVDIVVLLLLVVVVAVAPSPWMRAALRPIPVSEISILYLITLCVAPMALSLFLFYLCLITP